MRTLRGAWPGQRLSDPRRGLKADPTDIRDRPFVRTSTTGEKENLPGIGGGGSRTLIISKTEVPVGMGSWNQIQVE